MGYDANKVMPKDGWALLLADQQMSKTNSGLILPGETGAQKVTELAGEVKRIGGGAFNDNLRKQGLIEGARVLFRGYLKFANPLPNDETWEDGSPKQYFFIDCCDILGIVEPGVKVGVHSGRPMVPHIQNRQE